MEKVVAASGGMARRNASGAAGQAALRAERTRAEERPQGDGTDGRDWLTGYRIEW